jgi:hypothetical protein
VASRTIELVTVLSEELTKKFTHEKQYRDIDGLPDLNKHIKRAVSRFIADNVGYETNIPIAAISRYNSLPGNIPSIGLSAGDILQMKAGSALWQLIMPEDMAVSVAYEDLQAYSNILNRYEAQKASEETIEMAIDEFMDTMSVGYLERDDVISFIPFIDLQRCKFFARIDQSWGLGGFSIPGVEELKLSSMGVFHGG